MFKELIKRRDDFAEKLRVPELSSSLEWVSGSPLSFVEDLRAKLTVIFFWNSRCIHSQHGISWLKRIESQMADPRLAILGVHVGTSSATKKKETLERYIQLMDMRWPVAHDGADSIRHSFGIQELPTLLVISPKGHIIEAFVGEEWRYHLYSFLQECFHFYKDFDWNRKPFEVSCVHSSGTELYFPSSIAGNGDEYWVSDTGNHSIALIDEVGQVNERIGEKSPGFSDGSLESARFCLPRGLCLHENKLYVADTGNHAIRMIDLKTQRVKTLWGIGDIGLDYGGGETSQLQRLSSPWDLAHDGEKLWVSMAGTHQIWCMDTNATSCFSYSGTGKQASLDSGEPLAASWSFPSALTLFKGQLAIAEATAHTVRLLSRESLGSQKLIKDPYKLQTPTALLALEDEGVLLIVAKDSHQVWAFSPESKSLLPLADKNFFCEPSGIVRKSNSLDFLVVDSGNHRVCTLNIKEWGFYE